MRDVVRGYLKAATELTVDAAVGLRRRAEDLAAVAVTRPEELPAHLQGLAAEALATGTQSGELVVGLVRSEVEKAWHRVGDGVVQLGVILELLERQIRQLQGESETAPVAEERPVTRPERVRVDVEAEPPAPDEQAGTDTGTDTDTDADAAARRRAAVPGMRKRAAAPRKATAAGAAKPRKKAAASDSAGSSAAPTPAPAPAPPAPTPAPAPAPAPAARKRAAARTTQAKAADQAATPAPEPAPRKRTAAKKSTSAGRAKKTGGAGENG